MILCALHSHLSVGISQAVLCHLVTLFVSAHNQMWIFLKIIFNFSYSGVKMYFDFFSSQEGEELVLLNQNKPVGCT